MTATDELRRLLDERGVEWSGTSFSTPAKGHPTNTSLGEEHHEATFIEYDDGNVLRLFDLTTEQAVEATLGSGTCRVVRKPVSYSDDWKESLEAAGVVEVYTPTCSECGAYIEPPSEFAAGWKYCPNCGRRIEVDA